MNAPTGAKQMTLEVCSAFPARSSASAPASRHPAPDRRTAQGIEKSAVPSRWLVDAMFPKLLTEVKQLTTDDGRTVK
ncbi:hypothetical protein, partial [Glutamicibacter protophormiae]|uniref:hypothetical protein n=1 Tax=Glutamicibacter protophormiae TaxID=37930 RepID=UPI00331E2A5B